MAGSTAALICDTSALLDYLVESAPDHRLFRSAIDRARTRYVPALVLAELDYFLRNERRAMESFMRDLARGAFTYAPPALDELSRAMDIDRRYSDLSNFECAPAAKPSTLGAVYRLAFSLTQNQMCHVTVGVHEELCDCAGRLKHRLRLRNERKRIQVQSPIDEGDVLVHAHETHDSPRPFAIRICSGVFFEDR